MEDEGPSTSLSWQKTGPVKGSFDVQVRPTVLPLSNQACSVWELWKSGSAHRCNALIAPFDDLVI